MRYLVIIVSCLMILALGSAGAARATDLGKCVDDSPTTLQTGSASKADCDMGQKKAQKCDHNACYAYQLVAIAEVRDFSTPPLPRTAAVPSVVKHLTSSGGETLLDPPRA